MFMPKRRKCHDYNEISRPITTTNNNNNNEKNNNNTENTKDNSNAINNTTSIISDRDDRTNINNPTTADNFSLPLTFDESGNTTSKNRLFSTFHTINDNHNTANSLVMSTDNMNSLTNTYSSSALTNFSSLTCGGAAATEDYNPNLNWFHAMNASIYDNTNVNNETQRHENTRSNINDTQHQNRQQSYHNQQQYQQQPLHSNSASSPVATNMHDNGEDLIPPVAAHYGKDTEQRNAGTFNGNGNSEHLSLIACTKEQSIVVVGNDSCSDVLSARI